jgi:hypothetical protein
MPYEGIAARIKADLDKELGFTFSGRDRNAARATLGHGLAVSAFPRYVPV